MRVALEASQRMGKRVGEQAVCMLSLVTGMRLAKRCRLCEGRSACNDRLYWSCLACEMSEIRRLRPFCQPSEARVCLKMKLPLALVLWPRFKAVSWESM